MVDLGVAVGVCELGQSASAERESLIKPVVQLVVFLLELFMLVAFGWYGYSQPAGMLLRVGLGAGLVITAIVVWSVWAAPKSSRRLPLPALVLFRAAMFLLSAFFVYRLGHEKLALIVASLAMKKDQEHK